MQGLAILFLAIGIWGMYGGVTGVPPLTTIVNILRNPTKAAEVIETAKADAKARVAEYTEGYTVGGAVAGSVSNFIGGSNPFGKYKVTDDWDAHKARGTSAGGIDYAMPAGTPLPTPFSGTFTYTDGGLNGTNIATVTLDNGYKSEFWHVRRATAVSGSRVKAGQIVALSGGVPGEPGAGESDGAHLHWHMLDPKGNRISPLEYLKGK